MADDELLPLIEEDTEDLELGDDAPEDDPAALEIVAG